MRPSPKKDRSDERPRDVTQMLADGSQGDPAALATLMPLVYDELRRLARRYLRRERPDHTLEATALVHEAYLQLVGQKNADWQSRTQFVGIAAHVMRQILVQHARRHCAAKRGGHDLKVSMDEAVQGSTEQAVDLMGLDDALTRLAEIDPQKSRIVELRFFGGLTIAETAQVMGVSMPTVERGWRIAKLWIQRELLQGGGHDA